MPTHQEVIERLAARVDELEHQVTELTESEENAWRNVNLLTRRLGAERAQLREALLAIKTAVDESVSGVREVQVGEWLSLLNQAREALDVE